MPNVKRHPFVPIRPIQSKQLLYITEISAAIYYRKGKRVIKKSLLGENQAKTQIAVAAARSAAATGRRTTEPG